MSNPIRYIDTDHLIDPVSLTGANGADVDLKGKLEVDLQFDPAGQDGASTDSRLYYRLDEDAAAVTKTLAALKPMGKLTPGGCVTLKVSPTAAVQTLHCVLTDSAGTPIAGIAGDQLLFTPYKCNP